MSVELNNFKNLLIKNNFLVTKQRVLMFKIFQEQTSLSINELIAHLASVNTATIYRNIKIFEQLGVIHHIRLGWNSKLELSDKFHFHHHHLTCLNCKRTLTINENTLLESLIKEVAIKLNFHMTQHNLEIRGYCNSCNHKQPTFTDLSD